jgi:hypothetical protein
METQCMWDECDCFDGVANRANRRKVSRRNRVQPPRQQAGHIELAPGGFTLNGQVHELTGKPRDMLAALLESHYRRSTASDLRKVIGLDDEAVTYPEQAIKDTARKLRAALKRAVNAEGLPCENPLESTGKGKDLTYILNV